ncbi:MAG: hypothetical protein ACRDLS_17290, partial [Solirubrobacteraceae bacterium]
ARSGTWAAASKRSRAAARAWTEFRRGPVPPRLASEMKRALRTLRAAIARRDRTRAGSAAIDVAQSALDLELRHRPQPEIDLGRFELWAHQVLVDAATASRTRSAPPT